MSLLQFYTGIWLVVSVLGHNYSDTIGIVEYLFHSSRYNKGVKPVLNQSEVLQVNVSQTLIRLDSIDLNAGFVCVSAYFLVTWIDELLVWNPEQYGGIYGLTVIDNSLWMPKVQVAYAATDDSLLIKDETHAYITSDGQVFVFPSGKYNFQCNVNTKRYPFDRHFCQLLLYSSGYMSSELILQQSEGSPRLYQHFEEHEEWTMETFIGKSEITSEEDSRFDTSTVTYEFYLKRRPAFELLRSGIPALLLSITNFGTLLVPPDCGERLSFTITNFLALVFVNINTMDVLPRNALEMTPSSIHVLITNVAGSFAVFWSIYMVRLSRLPSENLNISTLLLRTAAWYKARGNARSNVRAKKHRVSSYCPEKKDNCNDIDTATAMRVIKDTGNGHGNRSSIKLRSGCQEIVNGLDVAILLDHICFIVSLAIYVVINIGLYFHIYYDRV